MPLTNARIRNLGATLSPREQKRITQATSESVRTIAESRRVIERILEGQDSRMIVIVGPCSIHDPEAAYEYGFGLRRLAARYMDRLLIVMRTYFEKPRTTTGWKGLLIEPYRDGRPAIDDGRRLARELLVKLTELGLPTATEFLDPNTPQILDDLISWAALGARTVESQTHREMASGLSMPVGFKNGTTGAIDIAVNAILAGRSPQGFVGIDEEGRESIIETQGNPYGHLILRGGQLEGPNYTQDQVEKAVQALRAKKLPERIIIDCSHANAAGNYRNQNPVLKSVFTEERHPSVVGIMLESNLDEGKQDSYGAKVNPRQSITDACIGWEETEELLAFAYEHAPR